MVKRQTVVAVRSFERSLRQCRRALELAPTSQTFTIRPFSTSRRLTKNGNLPVFTTTESPELNDLLSTMRSKIIVPAHLNLRQKKLIYKPRFIPTLTAEPFIVEIGSSKEPIQLEHIDRTKDVPNTRKSLLKCIDLMGDSPEAWRNLVPLLHGLNTAKRGWNTEDIVLMIRTAGERGMVHVIVEALRQVKKTNLCLHELRVAREAFWSLRIKAKQSGWEEEATSTALSYGKQMAELTELTINSKPRTRLAPVADPRVQPDIIAVLLELAAMRAVKHLRGQDEEGEVAKYAARVLPNVEGAASVERPKKQLSHAEALEADYQLLRWIPVLNGLKLAKKILEEKIFELVPGDSLQKRKVDHIISDIEKRVAKWEVAANGITAEEPDKQHSGRGLQWLAEIER